MSVNYDQNALSEFVESQDVLPTPGTLADLRLFTVPSAGIDRLNFVVWDVVEVLGVGEETIELKGHYTIARAEPTAYDWVNASVDITMLEMNVKGFSERFGPVHAGVNHDIGKPSRGEVKPGTVYPTTGSPKMCIMEGYMKFDMPAVGIAVFNKEAITLQHNITHIPPIGQGGGTRGRVAIPLYRVDDPDGPPAAVLRQVTTHIGSWLS